MKKNFAQRRQWQYLGLMSLGRVDRLSLRWLQRAGVGNVTEKAQFGREVCGKS